MYQGLERTGTNRTPYPLAGLDWRSHFERFLALSRTTEHLHSLWAGWIPDTDVSRCARKHVLYKVWSSIIYNHLKLETTQMSTDGRREKGAAYRNEGECSRCTHYVQISKQCSLKEARDKRVCTYNSISVNFKNRQNNQNSGYLG